MVRWLAVVLLACAGCGRLGFDASSPTGDASPEPDAVSHDAGLDPDLLVWLEFDEGSSAGVADTVATLGDGACAVERCPTNGPGLIGNAMKFDGVDDYLQFATTSELDFGGRDQPFSVSLWYRAVDLTPPMQQVLMAQATAGGSVSFQLSFEVWQGDAPLDLVWKVCETDCQSGQFAVASDLVAVDRWVFVAGVWDSSATRLYVDGILVAAVDKATIAFDGSPFMVGADLEPGTIDDSFDGLIDDVRVYRRALTPADLDELMKEALN